MKGHTHWQFSAFTVLFVVLAFWGSTEHDRSQDKRIDQQEKQITILLEELQK